MCVVTTESSPLMAFLTYNFPQLQEQQTTITISTCSSGSKQQQQQQQQCPSIVIQTDNHASRPLSPSSRRRLGLHSNTRSQSCDHSERRRRRARCRWSNEMTGMDHSGSSSSSSNDDDEPRRRHRPPAFRRNNTYPLPGLAGWEAHVPASTTTRTVGTAPPNAPPRRPQRRRSSASIEVEEATTRCSPPTRPGRVPRNLRNTQTALSGEKNGSMKESAAAVQNELAALAALY